MKLLIVGEKDDLRAQLLLGLGRERIVNLLEQGLIAPLPALVGDHGREVQVNLVSRPQRGHSRPRCDRR